MLSALIITLSLAGPVDAAPVDTPVAEDQLVEPKAIPAAATFGAATIAVTGFALAITGEVIYADVERTWNARATGQSAATAGWIIGVVHTRS